MTKMAGESCQSPKFEEIRSISTEMGKLAFLRLLNNHHYLGIHVDYIQKTYHNLTTQEAIEEKIDFLTYWPPCGLSMIKVH